MAHVCRGAADEERDLLAEDQASEHQKRCFVAEMQIVHQKGRMLRFNETDEQLEDAGENAFPENLLIAFFDPFGLGQVRQDRRQTGPLFRRKFVQDALPFVLSKVQEGYDDVANQVVGSV